LRKGLTIEERDLDFSLANLGEADRQTYAAKVKKSLNYVLSLHLNSALDSTEATELALTTVLRRKGRILEASTRTIEIIKQYGTSDDQGLLRQFIKLKQQIATLATAPSNELSSAEYQRRLANLRSEVNRLDNILARRSALLAPPSPTIELDAIQKQIPDNGVLIEYVLYQPFDPAEPIGDGFSATSGGPAQRFEASRYAAYLFFPDGTIKAVDLGNAAQIDAAIQSFGNLLRAPNSDFSRAPASIQVETTNTRVEAVANNIRELIFDPIAPYIQKQKHLLISPDSQLNRLPFEALQTDDETFLVEQYQISYLNSGRDLLRNNTRSRSNAGDVILANPNYGTSTLAQGPGSVGLNSLGQFAPLPGTAEEVASIAPLLSNATLLTEGNATETALKAVQSPRILHLATHGFFLPDVERQDYADNLGLFASEGPIATRTTTEQTIADPLLRSGLALAGFNSRMGGDDDDGIFTALEAANLNLTGTQLVVLSACDTGLGDIASGEGVYGLRRALSIAGAETQLMSLWQVSDFGTQSLMTHYYENLTSGMGRSEALRTAQLNMIQSDTYAHPYYWAAFILSGDWRPLE
ncbi:MAG: CHAT domain-containing protein, partial [Cyanobacteria bacterium J06642_11]